MSGKGDPNQEDGDYKKAIGVLYTIAFTLKMSYKTDFKIQGYFEYVVPPLEGFCVQIMHISSYDDEPVSIAIMDKYIEENNYKKDITKTRLHHEIYLSDARKVPPERRKTVIRIPIKKV